MDSRRYRFTQRRKDVGFTQESLAEHLSVERSTVVRWEAGETEPLPWVRPKIARALQVSINELGDLLTGTSLNVDNNLIEMKQRQRGNGVAIERSEFSAPPIDLDYIHTLRVDIECFVQLDQRFGGDETSPLIVRAFRQIRRRIDNSEIKKGVGRDIYAVAAEVAEVAGWSLYDAGEYEKAEQLNHESINLARLAGDRSMELFVLQNMSMQAGHLGRARVSLDIARLALDNWRLSPRLEALFKVREARALAQLNVAHEARQQLSHARGLFLEGVQEDDPSWAWWVDENELAWHEGMIELDLGRRRECVEFFEVSAAGIPGHRVRTGYNHHTSLLSAYVHNSAWREAETVMSTLLHQVGSVGSRRTDLLLGATLKRIDRAKAPDNVRDLASTLKVALVDGG